MVTVAPAAVVVGAPRLPLPYGLLSAVPLRSGDRWESGVDWDRLICDPVDGIGQWQVPPTATLGLPKNLARNGQGSGSATPFTVYGHFNCSPVGYTLAEAQAKANDHLLAREEQRVERAFWTGDLGNTPNLAAAATSLGAAVKPLVGLGMLEDYNSFEYGSLGVIHMRRGTASILLGLGLLETRGGRLFTKLGTPVVAGAGYPGTDKANGAWVAGKPWLYISPAVFGYRSEVFTSSNTAGDLFDRGVNNLYAVAERNYLFGFDNCGVGAVQLDYAL